MLTFAAFVALAVTGMVAWTRFRAPPRERDLLPMVGGVWEPVQFAPGSRLPEWDEPPPGATAAPSAALAEPPPPAADQEPEPEPVAQPAFARVA
jgi:hypothetical protein